jgi:hypothetical protein
MDKRTVLSSTLVGGKLLSLLLNLGGIFVVPLALWYGFCRRRTGLIALLAGIASGLILAWQGVDWRGAELALFVLMFSSGALTLMAVFRELDLPRRIEDLRGLGDKEQSSQDWLLLLWFSGIVFSCLLLYPSGSVRYVILLAPPLVLVWGMSLDRLVANPYFCRNLAGLAACLTCLLGLTISYADFKLAGTYRTFAREIIEEYQAESRTVWFAGEWGLRYYLESLGGKLLLRNSVEASPGDIIVKPYIASPWVTLYDGDKYTRLLEQREAPQGFPIRILDFFSHAGFYSTGWGILPFSWARSGERWEWINVFEVTNPYDGPIPESEKHW